jgi:hypothetical protein
MFVYVDESGDAGFKIGKGSSEYFVVSTVVIPDPLPLTLGLDELRESLGLPARFEFKFLSSNESRRRAVFEEIRRHDISIRGFVVNKRLLLDRNEFRSNGYFYGSLLTRALNESKSDFVEATITIDKVMGSKAKMQTLTSSLRQALQENVELSDSVAARRVKEILYKDSKSDPMIQVADMVAGAIAAHRRGTDMRCLGIFQARVRDILDWYGDD